MAEAWQTALRQHGHFASAELTVVSEGLLLERDGLRVYLTTPDHLTEDLLRDAIAGAHGLLLVGDTPAALSERLPDGALIAVQSADADPQAMVLAAHGLVERLQLRREADQGLEHLSVFRDERSELVDIARALSKERDIDSLLELILERSRYITKADAGSIYVLEGAEGDTGRQVLRFKSSQNDSVRFESAEFVMNVSTDSIAGAAVVTRKAINIDDVTGSADDLPYRIDRSFDERVGYRTVSMLTMPMLSSKGAVVGVIQLINRKASRETLLKSPQDFDAHVEPFDDRSEGLLTTLSAQAGIALENAQLYEEIRGIFEGFVRASVQAIEQRDPTTSGHSLRVSVLSCQLAQVVDRVDRGSYKDARFDRRDIQELQYASLLHDFGKIGVREEVLVKAKKLYPYQYDAIRARIDFALRSAENEMLARKLEAVQAGAGASDLRPFDEAFAARTAELEDAWTVIQGANEPTVLREGDFSRIAGIGAMGYTDLSGQTRPFLSADEVVALQITRGSLSPGEIDEIRSHVVHTYNFLAKIPWGQSMSGVPLIAGAHHEKLDGSGYPDGILGTDIPLPSKIMTIADIYDALTARDRPYKKALANERALQILGFEVKDGHLDAELVEIFAEAEVFKAADAELEY